MAMCLSRRSVVGGNTLDGDIKGCSTPGWLTGMDTDGLRGHRAVNYGELGKKRLLQQCFRNYCTETNPLGKCQDWRTRCFTQPESCAQPRRQRCCPHVSAGHLSVCFVFIIHSRDCIVRGKSHASWLGVTTRRSSLRPCMEWAEMRVMWWARDAPAHWSSDCSLCWGFGNRWAAQWCSGSLVARMFVRIGSQLAAQGWGRQSCGQMTLLYCRCCTA